MTPAAQAPVLHHLRRLALRHDGNAATDGQLLECFLEDGDETAFAALVRRHGPMVLGVCRRVLRDLHDAEDAFQATFLVFLRKARSIDQPDRLGNWLYGVAAFTARNARVARSRRQAAEHQLREQVRPQPDCGPPDDDWRPVLDGELSRLPDKYRVPLVLCELQGRPRRDAARQLGWSEGTLSSRLARGRALLRRRLLRRGVALSAAGLATLLTAQTAAAVPAALVQSTAQAATAVAAGSTAGGLISTTVLTLTQGVLQAMFLTKLKMAAVWLVLAGILGTGVTVFTHQALAQKPAAPEVKNANADQKPKDPAAPSLQAAILDVDAAKHTLTIVTGDKANKQEKTLSLAKDVKVLLRDGVSKDEPAKEGKLTDLSAGMRATLQLSADEKTIVVVTPAPLHVGGGIKAVDANQKTITIHTKNKTGADEQSYRLADSAKVLLNDGLKKGDADTEGKLADLQEGMHVSLHVSLVDRTKVLSVRVHGASLHGTVAGLDLGNKTITLSVKEDAQKVDKTITLIQDARVDTGLVVGDTASVRLSVFDKTKAVAVHKVTKGEKEE